MSDGADPGARFSCARDASNRDEPVFATASHVHRWVFLERPGPWGRHAVTDSHLSPQLAAALQARADRYRARLVLIRRHGRYQPVGARAFFAVTRPQGCWLEEVHLDEAAALLQLDWAGLRGGGGIGWPRHKPLYLVCANGRHDPCCAEFGRPLAASLTATLGEPVWECSHIGGDRFAGNLLCFPHGLYFGQVEPAHGLEVASAYAAGRLVMPLFRGRSAYPFAVQAAEHYTLVETGLRGVEDLSFVASDVQADRCTAVFDGPDHSRYQVQVHVRRAPPAVLTCSADTALRAPRYELGSITAVARSPGG